MVKQIKILLASLFSGKGHDDLKSANKDAEKSLDSLAKKSRTTYARHVKDAENAAKGVGNLSSAVNVLAQGTGFLGKMATEVFRGGLWAAGAAAARLALEKLIEAYKSAWEQIEKIRKNVVDSLDAQIRHVKAYKSAIAEMAAAETAAINATLEARKKEIDLTERLTKAAIELARQKRIAAGESPASVNDVANEESQRASADAAAKRADKEIRAAQKRLQAAKAEKFAADKEVKRLQESRNKLYKPWEFDDPKAQRQAARLRDAAASIIRDVKREADAAQKRIIEANAALDAAKESKRALLIEQEAADLKLANEREAAEKNAAEERRKAEQRAADERIKAEQRAADERIKAEQRAADELRRIEDEAHRRRIENIRSEIAESNKAAADASRAAAAAQSEFDRAFALFRDPAKAAAQIGEERDYRADLERLHKSASRYGGKWRIDALAQLMQSGDSAAVSDTLADWRKSRSFSPEIEAMVRASAAELTKTSSLDELRKISANTDGLAAKLDQLLQIKGG